MRKLQACFFAWMSRSEHPTEWVQGNYAQSSGARRRLPSETRIRSIGLGCRATPRLARAYSGRPGSHQASREPWASAGAACVSLTQFAPTAPALVASAGAASGLRSADSLEVAEESWGPTAVGWEAAAAQVGSGSNPATAAAGSGAAAAGPSILELTASVATASTSMKRVPASNPLTGPACPWSPRCLAVGWAHASV